MKNFVHFINFSKKWKNSIFERSMNFHKKLITYSKLTQKIDLEQISFHDSNSSIEKINENIFQKHVVVHFSWLQL